MAVLIQAFKYIGIPAGKSFSNGEAKKEKRYNGKQ